MLNIHICMFLVLSSFLLSIKNSDIMDFINIFEQFARSCQGGVFRQRDYGAGGLAGVLVEHEDNQEEMVEHHFCWKLRV